MRVSRQSLANCVCSLACSSKEMTDPAVAPSDSEHVLDEVEDVRLELRRGVLADDAAVVGGVAVARQLRVGRDETGDRAVDHAGRVALVHARAHVLGRGKEAFVGSGAGSQQRKAARFAHIAAHQVGRLEPLAYAIDVEGAGRIARRHEGAKSLDLALRRLQRRQDGADDLRSPAQANRSIAGMAVQPGAHAGMCRAHTDEHRLAVVARVLGNVVDGGDGEIGIQNQDVCPTDGALQRSRLLLVREDVGVVHGGVDHRGTDEPLVLIEDGHVAAATHVPAIEVLVQAQIARIHACSGALVLDDFGEHRVLRQDRVHGNAADGLALGAVRRQIGGDVVGAAADGMDDAADFRLAFVGGLGWLAECDGVEVHRADREHALSTAEPQHGASPPKFPTLRRNT